MKTPSFTLLLLLAGLGGAAQPPTFSYANPTGYTASFSRSPEVENGVSLQNGIVINGDTLDDPFSKDTVLPIRLQAFTLEPGPTGNILQWRSAHEDPGDRYVLQRSSDGRHFTAVAEMPAQFPGSGGGYRFLDAAPFSRNVCYRLLLLDIAGAARYSEVLSAAGAGQEVTLQLLENPVKEFLRIRAVLPGGAQAAATLYSAGGRPVGTFQLADGDLRIPAGSLPPGHYVLSCRLGSEQRRVTFLRL